jgi:hypothetical protein
MFDWLSILIMDSNIYNIWLYLYVDLQRERVDAPKTFQIAIAHSAVLHVMEVVLNSTTLAFSLAMLAVASQFAINSVEDLIKLTQPSEASVGFAILSMMTSVPKYVLHSSQCCRVSQDFR